jgi:hypothetical protein
VLCGVEQKFDVASQMIDAFGCNRGIPLCFCQYEGALQYGLRMQREAARPKQMRGILKKFDPLGSRTRT